VHKLGHGLVVTGGDKIKTNYFMPLRHQALRKLIADESGRASDAGSHAE
jgi:hypothetical protein